MPAEKEHIDLPNIDLLLRRLRESNFVAVTVVPAEEDGFYQLQIGEKVSIEKDP